MINKKVIAAAILVNLVCASAASAVQFTSKANERNNVVAGAPAPNAGGNSCATATPIPTLPRTDTGTTVGAASTVGTLPSGCSDYTSVAGPDQIYTFTTGAGASVGISVTPTTATYDAAVYVLSTCGNAATCVVGSDAVLAGATESIPAQNYPAGTYGLYVDSFYTATATCPQGGVCGSGAYTLNVTGNLPVQLTKFSVD